MDHTYMYETNDVIPVPLEHVYDTRVAVAVHASGPVVCYYTSGHYVYGSQYM